MHEVTYLQSIPWFAWIPIVAIVGGIVSNTLCTMQKRSHRHRERMAMIQQGMNPDLEGKPSTIGEL